MPSLPASLTSVPSHTHCAPSLGVWNADATHCLAKRRGAGLEGVALVRGHARLEGTARAPAPDDGRQRDRHAVALAVRRHRQEDSLVAEDRLGDLGARDTDPEL